MSDTTDSVVVIAQVRANDRPVSMDAANGADFKINQPFLHVLEVSFEPFQDYAGKYHLILAIRNF